MLAVCQQVAAIPMKRAAPPETRFLERDEIEAPAAPPAPRRPARAAGPGPAAVPLQHRRAGAGGRRPARRAPRPRRAPARPPARQGRQVADLPALAADRATAERAARLGRPDRRRRRRRCSPHAGSRSPDSASTRSCADTRPASTTPAPAGRVSPHTFRHTAAVHLLEAGVEVNVIRGWLGHADLTTTNRYAEINTKTKLAALRACEPPGTSAGSRTTPIWRSDEIAPQLARLALIVMWPMAASIPRSPGTDRHRPHNAAGHRTRNMWRATFSGTSTLNTPPKKLHAASHPAITAASRLRERQTHEQYRE